jgi:5-oxopent-3-ene-1,2,5-tricarboxylate decarboxylase / 2-hydroxyhepta-2,4-diene-1,7-dioate isomerase
MAPPFQRLTGRNAGMTLPPRGSTDLAMPADALVYGVLLNMQADVVRMGERFAAPPYKAPPRAPVLYVKPANTHVGHGATVALPPGAARLTAGATLGLVIGRTACRRTPADALDVLAGVTLVLDLSLPHESLHRPPIVENCFDGACPIGPWCTPASMLPDLARVVVQTGIDGTAVAETRFDALVRPIPQLLADVTAFMTLHPGDILLAGMPLVLPDAREGQRIAAHADGLGTLEVLLADGGAR